MPLRVRIHAARHSFFVMCKASSHNAMQVSMPLPAPATLSVFPLPPLEFIGCCCELDALPELLTVGLLAALLELLGSPFGLAGFAVPEGFAPLAFVFGG